MRQHQGDGLMYTNCRTSEQHKEISDDLASRKLLHPTLYSSSIASYPNHTRTQRTPELPKAKNQYNGAFFTIFHRAAVMYTIGYNGVQICKKNYFETLCLKLPSFYIGMCTVISVHIVCKHYGRKILSPVIFQLPVNYTPPQQKASLSFIPQIN